MQRITQQFALVSQQIIAIENVSGTYLFTLLTLKGAHFKRRGGHSIHYSFFAIIGERKITTGNHKRTEYLSLMQTIQLQLAAKAHQDALRKELYHDFEEAVYEKEAKARKRALNDTIANINEVLETLKEVEVGNWA